MPVALDQTHSIIAGTTLSLTLQATDADQDPLGYRVPAIQSISIALQLTAYADIQDK